MEQKMSNMERIMTGGFASLMQQQQTPTSDSSSTLDALVQTLRDLLI